MRFALREAEMAAAADEVPVGAVIVHQGRIIARGHNQKEQLTDPTAHAEMIAITAAAEALGDWRMNDCTLFVTLEPCAMCAGAIVLARMGRLVYGTDDPKTGACGSMHNLVEDPRANHQVSVARGVLADDCAGLLHAFFGEQRARGKK